MIDSAVNVADRLHHAIERLTSPTCVGLDPVVDRLPAELTSAGADPVAAIDEFCRGILDAIAGIVPCVKIQSACFERYGADGVSMLNSLLAHAGQQGIVTILDAKRGDIGISARHYAAAAFGKSGHTVAADWVTVNPYLGMDGLEPFLEAGGGIFALVRTSNPGGDALQGLPLADGRFVADAVADLVASLGDGAVGASGYSAVGAVVGATKSDDAVRLRARMPQQIFLVPGYGAQGGGVKDVLPCFNADGRGAIVTASRSVIYAFEGGPASAAVTGWRDMVHQAAVDFADEVGRGTGWR